jgi:hypothetical protein
MPRSLEALLALDEGDVTKEGWIGRRDVDALALFIVHGGLAGEATVWCRRRCC